jgi:hypothetical protein
MMEPKKTKKKFYQKRRLSKSCHILWKWKQMKNEKTPSHDGVFCAYFVFVISYGPLIEVNLVWNSTKIIFFFFWKWCLTKMTVCMLLLLRDKGIDFFSYTSGQFMFKSAKPSVSWVLPVTHLLFFYLGLLTALSPTIYSWNTSVNEKCWAWLFRFEQVLRK